jgi:Gly-Xaa carboxypeptidase
MTSILHRSADKSAALGAPATASHPARSTVHRLLRWAVLAVVLSSSLFVLYPEAAVSILRGCSNRRVTSVAEMCAQEEALVPRTHIYAKVGEELATDAFRMRAVKWQSGAIQIPTESYDMMEDVGKDPRWEAFGPFHDYLKKSFPLVCVPPWVDL